MLWDSNAILWGFNATLWDSTAMLCYVMLCYAMLIYAYLCYAMLWLYHICDGACYDLFAARTVDTRSFQHTF